jgi:hypothetical protein
LSGKGFIGQDDKSERESRRIWRDRETGFDKKVTLLLKITTLAEKIELVGQNSASLKYYPFPSILIESDSIGYDLLRKFITDTMPLYRFCSCVTEDDAIGLRLAFLYYGFIWLKYHECASGTIEGISFWIGSRDDLRGGRKKWKQKINQFKTVVMNVIPDFRNYLPLLLYIAIS